MLTQPVSASQKNFWLEWIINKDSCQYNALLGFWLTGSLQITRLQRALSIYCNEWHHGAKSFFVEENGQIFQRFLPSIDPNLQIEKLSDQHQLEQSVFDFSTQPFDITSPPLSRFLLLQVTTRQYLLIANFHHIIFDARTAHSFIDTISSLYDSKKNLSTRPIKSIAAKTTTAADSDYWMQKLLSADLYLDLPIKQQAQKTSDIIRSVYTTLGKELLIKTKRIAKQQRTTPFLMMTSLFAAFLYRQIKQSKFLISYVVDTRSKDQKNYLGCMVNSLPLEFDFSQPASFAALIAKTTQQRKDDRLHQHLAMADVVSDLRKLRHLDPNNFLNVSIFETYLDNRGLSLPEVESHAYQFSRRGGDVELGVGLSIMDELPIRIDYNESLFSASVIHVFVAHFKQFYQAACESITQEVQTLSYLPASMDASPFVRWQPQPVKPISLMDAFHASVKRFPHKIALIDGDKSYTYQALLQEVKLTTLQLKEVWPHNQKQPRVALMAQRKATDIISLLAIFELGATCVPIDVKIPAERVKNILSDANISIVLSENKVKVRRTTATAKEVNDDIAYWIYTSGSTGEPKSVGIRRYSLECYLYSAIERYKLKASDRILQFTSLSFDPAFLEICGALCCGASLVMLDESVLSSAAAFFAFCQSNQVSFINCSTAYWQFLATQTTPSIAQNVQYLRTIVFGGEKASLTALAQWQTLFGQDIHLINAYGPSEITIDALAFDVNNTIASDIVLHSVPIGYPLPHVSIKVVDQAGQTVTCGEPGELWIAGPTLAVGIHDTWYRTGDQVKYHTDGCIEFIGRLDRQIKFRGYRIELSDIEACLCKIVAVKAAVVTVDNKVTPKLLAYLVTDQDNSSSQWREILAKYLPAYMIPDRFIRITAIPLTLQGKVDFTQLPALSSQEEQSNILIDNPIFRQLMVLWQELFSVETIEPHYSLFQFGGGSLSAISLANRIQKQFRVVCDVNAVFRNDTLILQTAYITECFKQPAKLISYREHSNSHPIVRAPLSPIQERFWAMQQFNPGLLSAYNVPYCCSIVGELILKDLSAAINEVFAAYHLTHVRVRQDGDDLYQEVIDFTPIYLSKHIVSIDQVNDLLVREFDRKFDLTKGILYHVDCLQVDINQHFLIINCHHFICDGWSLDKLIYEILQLYYSKQQQKNSRFVLAQPYQYLDYCASQAADSMPQEQVRSFWERYLDKIQPTQLALTCMGTKETHEATVHSFAIDMPLFQSIKSLANSVAKTDFVIFLGAFFILLSRYSQQTNNVVGIPIQCRDRDQLSNVVGPLVNILPMKSCLVNTQSFIDYLHCLSNQINELMIYKDTPFQEIVRYWSRQSETSTHPIFTICFNYEQRQRVLFDKNDLKVTVAATPISKTKYDLQCYLEVYEDQVTCRWVVCHGYCNTDFLVVMQQHYVHLLKQIIDCPQLPICRYKLWDALTQRILRHDQLPMKIESYLRVDQLVERAAQRYPHAIAIETNKQKLLYCDLIQLIDQCSEKLKKEGISTGDAVALYASASPELIINTLSLFRLGAVVLLLDPDYDQQHLLKMIRVSGIRRVIALNTPLPPEMVVDDKSSASNKLNGAAYIFFTSGTTGEPKQIKGTHQGLSHFLQWQQREFAINYLDVGVLLTSVSFDVVLRDMLLPLIVGARLTIPNNINRYDGIGLLQWMVDKSVTFIHMVPSRFESWLLALEQPLRLPMLRAIFFAGEQLTVQHLRLVKSKLVLKSPIIVNLYGPTETTLAKLFYRVTDTYPMDIIPVGQPMPGAQCTIYNEQTMCGIGEPGMVLIRTPYRAVPEERYQTGDIGVRLPDGNVLLLGRADQQVKISGVRVHLGRLAYRIKQHPDILDAVVRISSNRPVVYYLPQGNRTPKRDELIKFLQPYFTQTVIPSYWIHLSTWPLTVRGKLDYSKLPKPSEVCLPTNQTSTLTRTEKSILAIWYEVLDTKAIHPEDDFFSVGGHSLSLTRVMARINKEFQITISAAELFKHRSLQAMAQLVIKTRDDKGSVAAVTFCRAADQQKFLLSSQQQRLWYLCQLNRESTEYHIASAFLVKGIFDVKKFKRSLILLASRHTLLRSVVTAVDDQLFFHVHNPKGLSTELPLTVSTFSGEDINTELRRLVHSPFVLQGQLLWRCHIIKSSNNFIFLMNCHHLIADAWSIRIFMQDLCTRNLSSSFIASYADYVTWSMRYLQSKQQQTREAYWKKKLINFSELNLPIDYPRPDQSRGKGRQLYFEWSKTQTKKLRDFAYTHRITESTVLLSVYAIMLSLFSDQDDLLIGMPFANRPLPEFEKTFGLFAQTLPIRLILQRELPVIDILNNCHKLMTTLQDHQNIQLEKVINELNVKRTHSRLPLYQVMFSLQNVSDNNSFSAENLEFCDYYFDPETAKCDCYLATWFDQDRLRGYFEYNTDVLMKETIDYWCEFYQKLLLRIMQSPSLPMQHWMFTKEASTTICTQKSQYALIEYFDACAAAHADNIAIETSNNTISYKVLKQRSMVLASYLIDRYSAEIAQSTCIGVHLMPGIDFVVTILAILRCSKAYLPLSRHDPTDRLQYIISDNNCSLIISHNSVESLNQFVVVVALAESDGEINDYQQVIEMPPYRVDHPAYCMYTSGSTGCPKGVVVSQQAVIDLLYRPEWLIIKQQDGIGFCSDVAFDASTFEIWGTLLNGARLILFPLEQGLINGITILWMTARLFEFYTLRGAYNFSQLHYLIVGGDIINPLAVQRCFANPTKRPQYLLNGYGPTEGTVFTTIHTVTSQDQYRISIPIGHAVAGRQVDVCDKRGNVLLPYVPGELWIGGAGLANGYWQQDDLNSKYFVMKENKRYYRSGDLAYKDSQGNLIFLGRLDRQVKIRGFRVELESIQNHLLQISGVVEAYVCKRVYGNRNHLLGYYVAQSELSERILKDELRKRLPDYMVPTRLIAVTQWPLTCNHKIDIDKLPLPVGHTPKLVSELLTSTEQQLFTIWSNVLANKPSSVDDNFFELGGDSIISIQMYQQAQRQQLHFTFKDFLQTPTIRHLAQVCTKSGPQPDNRAATLPMETSANSPIQQWFFDQALPQVGHFNQSILLKVEFNNINATLLERAWLHVLKQQPVFRTRFYRDVTTGHWRKDFVDDKQFATSCHFIHSDWRGENDQRFTRWQANFDLTNGPIMTIGLLKNKQQLCHLLIVIHHLYIDAVSWRVLLYQLEQTYLAMHEQRALPQLNSAINCQQWIAQLRAMEQQGKFTQDETYWLSICRMPNRFCQIDSQMRPWRIVKKIEFDLVLSKAALTITQRSKVTVRELLLCALLQTLCQSEEVSYLKVNLEHHGRENDLLGVQVDSTIGWLTSLFPVLLTLPKENHDPRQVLLAVREVVNQIPNRGISYGALCCFGDDAVSKTLKQGLSDIVVNYLGDITVQNQAASIFNVVSTSVGQRTGTNNPPLFALEINAWMEQKKIHVHCTFDGKKVDPKMIVTITQQFSDHFQQLCRLLVDYRGGWQTPSDFSQVVLSQDEVDSLTQASKLSMQDCIIEEF